MLAYVNDRVARSKCALATSIQACIAWVLLLVSAACATTAPRSHLERYDIQKQPIYMFIDSGLWFCWIAFVVGLAGFASITTVTCLSNKADTEHVNDYVLSDKRELDSL